MCSAVVLDRNVSGVNLIHSAGCGRYGELIINTNNILLKIIIVNFNMLQFTVVFQLVFRCFIFCV
jgi:hypothetical protein